MRRSSGEGRRPQREAPKPGDIRETVVKINRCATVVKGGRRFSFSALVVVGDGAGRVGWGYGKANEVPPSVEKAVKDGRKKLRRIAVVGGTLPHEVVGSYRSSRVMLKPAPAGTGIKAGAAVRAVMEAAGVRNVYTKVYGSTNPVNVVKATMDGVGRLRTREAVAALRGVAIDDYVSLGSGA
ncbi:MAG: 30S ribosomal protein S5 [Planctomycetes bacterium]|nr:30S ribosomal protein S5 [Planctomycetota bacterium]